MLIKMIAKTAVMALTVEIVHRYMDEYGFELLKNVREKIIAK